MADPAPAEQGKPRDEIYSEIFTGLVLQQSSMALMLMGRSPHPESGEFVRDLESAKTFIDHLEMIEAKTAGNLNSEEAGLLQRNLAFLKKIFTEEFEGQLSNSPS